MFSCHRRSSEHAYHDRREVFVGNDGLFEEPDTDECPAGPAASPGHRPASPRSSRHQCAAVLFIGRSIHTNTHTRNTRIHTQRDYGVMSYTHRETKKHRA